jgi:hypothetical protein
MRKPDLPGMKEIPAVAGQSGLADLTDIGTRTSTRVIKRIPE